MEYHVNVWFSSCIFMYILYFSVGVQHVMHHSLPGISRKMVYFSAKKTTGPDMESPVRTAAR